MRLNSFARGLIAGVIFTLACGGDGTTDPEQFGTDVTLTAAQATNVTAAISQIGRVHSDLKWLGDSANLVLKSGAVAKRVAISTNLASGPFYAVSLQRGVASSTHSFATFDFIAFDNPSHPTAFIVVDGYADGAGAAPPTSASGRFETMGGGVFGHLFLVSGNIVEGWRSEVGEASLVGALTGPPCEVFQDGGGVTCSQSLLQTTFTISIASHDNMIPPADTRFASLSTTNVAGVLLNFQN